MRDISIIFILLMGALSALAADINYIEPGTSLENACVDTDPAGDGFGWDGICTCRIDAVYREFGIRMVEVGGNLIVGASEAPGSCANSGSASIYSTNGVGTLPEKTQELVSTSRVAGDAFSSTSLQASGDLLAVRSVETGNNAITVYRQTAGQWQQLTILRSATDPYSGFGSRMIFVGNYFAVMEYNQIIIYNEDYSVHQQIPADTGEFIDLRKTDQGMIARRIFDNGNGTTLLENYELQGTQFTRTAQIDFTNSLASYDVKGDLLVTGELGPLSLERESSIRTFRYTAGGVWSQSGSVLSDVGETSVTRVRLAANHLVTIQNSELVFHELNSAGNWVEAQRLVASESDNTKELSIVGSESNNIVVIARDLASGDQADIKAYSRDANNDWQESVSQSNLQLSSGYSLGPDSTTAVTAGILLSGDTVYAATTDSRVLVLNIGTDAANPASNGNDSDHTSGTSQTESTDTSGGGVFSILLLLMILAIRHVVPLSGIYRPSEHGAKPKDAQASFDKNRISRRQRTLSARLESILD